MKRRLLEIINKFSIDTLEFESENGLPAIVFANPKVLDDEETADKSPLGHGKFLDWTNPSEGIARVILNDFLILDVDFQEGISQLLLWNFWKSVKNPERIEDLHSSLDRHRKALKNAEKRVLQRRMEFEHVTVNLCEITSQMLEKTNLKDFLAYGLKHKSDIQQLMKTATLTDYTLGSSERLFLDLIENKGRFVTEELAEKLEKLRKTGDMKLILDNKIFSRFFNFVFELSEQKLLKISLSEISGGYSKAAKEVDRFKSFMKELNMLLRKRKAVIIYAWNVPFDKEAKSHSKLPKIYEWLESLRCGEFYSFNPETIKAVEGTFRKVRNGKEPEPFHLTWELTNVDIYRFHPRGKDPEFWSEILDDMRNQSARALESYHRT